jgi:hypothetical protein
MQGGNQGEMEIDTEPQIILKEHPSLLHLKSALARHPQYVIAGHIKYNILVK